jgi:hypothetical protein
MLWFSLTMPTVYTDAGAADVVLNDSEGLAGLMPFILFVSEE